MIVEYQRSYVWHMVTGKMTTSGRYTGAAKASNYLEIGDVPQHWRVVRFKDLSIRNNGGEVIDKSHWLPGDELLYTCQRDPIPCSFTGFPDEKRTTADDLLVTRNGTPYVFNPIPNSIYSNVVQRYVIDSSVNKHFLAYALQSIANELHGIGVSIESFRSERWERIGVPLPPRHEQDEIVKELDRFGTTVPDPRLAIDALDAWYQSEVWHIVTGGGIGNNASWNSNVPKTWRRCRVEQLARIESGYPFRADMFKVDGRYPVLRQGDVEQGMTELFTDEETNAPIVQNGDFLICQSGDFKLTEWVGNIAYLNQRVAVLHDVHPLLRYVLPFSLREMQNTTNPTTIQNLSIDDFRKIIVFLPPDEKTAISRLDSVAEIYNRQRAILEELAA